jgi:TRAP-type transport system small permease protein
LLAATRLVADRLINSSAVVLMLTLLGVVVMGIAFRLAGDPLVWTDELARYLLVWLSFVGWIVAARRRSHIRITILIDRLPIWGRRSIEVAIQASVLVFCAVLFWQGMSLVERNLDVEAVSMPIPSALLYVPILFAGLAVALQALGGMAEAVRGVPPAEPERLTI